MKKILQGLLFLVSLSLYAGDLRVNCYINDDQGDYLDLSDVFKNHQTSLHFNYDLSKYDVSVTRTSLFGEYIYSIIKTNRLSEVQQKITSTVSAYDQSFSVDEEVSCVVSD